MSLLQQNQTNQNENTEKQWKSIYLLGGVTTLIVIMGTILDIIVGTVTGGDLSSIPQTAIDKFAQFQNNWLLGLYNLDMLNFFTTILMIPTYFALCAAHRRVNIAYSVLATIIYFIGATVFISNNIALTMLELSNKYAVSTAEAQKNLFAAAGEAMIARGAHGSPGAFPGFILSAIASLVMSYAMLKGKIFGKPTAFTGILGSALLIVYLILVTFVPAIKNVAVIIAAPGGLLALAWMIMFTIRLFKLGSSSNK